MSEMTLPEGIQEVLKIEINETSGEREIQIPDYMTRYELNAAAVKLNPPAVKITRMLGRGNVLYIGKNVVSENLTLRVFGTGNRIILGSDCKLTGSIAVRGDNRMVLIGTRTTFNSVAIHCKQSGHVYIGRDCMFSSGIEIRTSDSHGVIDTKLNQRVNHAKGVYIGDHVWVSKHSTINKGAFVADDNIIGMTAVVRGAYLQSNTIIAGAPGKVVREDRSWSRDELVDPSVTDIYAWKNYNLL